MPKLNIILAICFVNISLLNSQDISLISLDTFFTDLTISTCKTNTYICPHKFVTPYAYHPFGFLLEMKEKRIDAPLFNDSVSFYKIDPISCSEELIFSFKMHNFSSPQGCLNVDNFGRIYTYNTRNKSIYRSNYLGDSLHLVCANIGKTIKDIIFTKNKLFAFDDFSEVIYQLDTNFNQIKTFIPPLPLKGITSIPINCDSILYIACSLDKISIAAFLDTMKTTGLHTFLVSDSTLILNYDVVNNTIIDTFCRIKLPFKNNTINVSSPLEFLSSESECDLLIDLDRNNSSGLLPYDFDLHNKVCDLINAPICDSDVYVHTSIPMDSVRFEIHGAVDMPFEELQIVPGFPAGYQLLKRDDTTYVMIPGVNNTDSEIAIALKNISYVNLKVPSTSGLRQIRLQGYNAIKKGVWVSSFIRLGHKPNSGNDTSLTICLDPLMVDAISLLINGEQGGSWSPGFKSGTNLFNSNNDTATFYSYITTDLYCGSDTALLQIKKGDIIPIDLGPDHAICKGDSIPINLIDPKISSVVWNDGNQQTNRRLYQQGKYIVEITSKTGCKSSDTITITKSTFLFDKSREDSVCIGQNYNYKGKNYKAGTLILDTLIAVTGCDTLLQLQLYEKNTPKIETNLFICEGQQLNYKGQDYHGGEDVNINLTSSSSGCDTIEHIIVSSLTKPDITFSVDSVICKNSTNTIQVNSHFQYSWSTKEQTQNITISQAGKFSITVTDQNGCTAFAEKEIKDAPILQYASLIQDPKCFGEENGSIRIELQPLNSKIQEYQLNSQKQSIGLFDNLKAGNYKLILTDEYGCKYEEFIDLKDPVPIQVNLPTVLEIEEGETKQVLFKLESGTIKNIIFTPNEGIKKINDSLYFINSKVNTEYRILIEDENGCTKEYILSVIFSKSGDLYLPTVFSPNGDGVNDRFYPISKYPKSISLFAIYDRWGEQIYLAKDIQSNQEAQGWNGRFKDQEVLPGVYIFMIEYTNSEGKLTRKNGNVTVVR